MLYVVYDEAGGRYFLDSFGTMSTQDTCVPGRTTLDSAQLADMTADTDPVLAEAISSRAEDCDGNCCAYAESALEDYFSDLAKQ